MRRWRLYAWESIADAGQHVPRRCARRRDGAAGRSKRRNAPHRGSAHEKGPLSGPCRRWGWPPEMKSSVLRVRPADWRSIRARCRSGLQARFPHVFGACAPAAGQLKNSFALSNQPLSVGLCFSPPFLSDSSSSFSTLRWCSVSFTGVSTRTWQYRSPG